jgi:hypothetical protein
LSTGAERNPVDVETLLIIRMAQQVGPNSWVWSVAVWRLDVVNSAQDRIEKAPAVKKT